MDSTLQNGNVGNVFLPLSSLRPMTRLRWERAFVLTMLHNWILNNETVYTSGSEISSVEAPSQIDLTTKIHVCKSDDV